MADFSKAVTATQYPVDKIVKVMTGSYNRATDVIKRTFTQGGIPTDFYFYRLLHGFTRPVFTDLLTSTDNITFVDDGTSTGRISFSDSTYVYILDSPFSPASGTMHYKLVCVWIDNFDDTNPTIEIYDSPAKATKSDSRNNYQKIALQGVANFSAGTFGSTQEIAVPLPSGLVTTAFRNPNYRVFFEALPGEVWPVNFGGIQNPFNLADSQNELVTEMNSVSLRLMASRFSNTAFKAWYRIYLDMEPES